MLPDGNLDPSLRRGRGILMNLVASPKINENGLAYLANPFAHRVLDVWEQGGVPRSELLDYFLQEGDGVLWEGIAQWCEYPGDGVRNLVWFLDHVMEEEKKKTQGGWSMAGSATLSRQGECPLAAMVPMYHLKCSGHQDEPNETFIARVRP